MKKQKAWFFKPASILLGIMAALTLLPWSGMESKSILGYAALCPFSPISTGILLYAALMTNNFRKQKQTMIPSRTKR